MPQLGGFFAVAYLAEGAIQAALDTVWEAEWRRARRQIHFEIDTGFGRLAASGAISLEQLKVQCVGSANAVRASLRAVAWLEVALDGVDAGGTWI